MNPWTGWLLAAAALVIGYLGDGWRGTVLALSITAFWLLLQYSRTLRTLRLAGQSPVGHIDDAAWLRTRLRPGMTMLTVLPLTRSLGTVVGAPEHETFRWTDAAGQHIDLVFRRGRLSRWTPSPAGMPDVH